MKTRVKLLNQIISYQNISDSIFQDVYAYPWDYDGEGAATLSTKDVKHILNLYLNESIQADDVHKWAEFLECRDDVDYDNTIIEILFELANPDINGKITPKGAELILQKI